MIRSNRIKEGQTARECAVQGCDQRRLHGCYRAVLPIFGCARLPCSWKVNSHNVPPISLVLFSFTAFFETKFRSKQIVPRIVICEPHNQLSPFARGLR
jgi:hypothetical protein